MSYTPTNWQTGDTITADKLNKMDPGWGTGTTQLFSETVTTAAGGYGYQGVLVYAAQIDAATIIVQFDGVDYTCDANDMGGGSYIYGGFSQEGPDFTDYPFAIFSQGNAGGGNQIFTETAGSHTVSASIISFSISDNFKSVVAECVDDYGDIPLHLVPGETTITVANAAKDAGRMMYFWTDSYGCFFVNTIDAVVEFVPENNNVVASFGRDDGLFTVTES